MNSLFALLDLNAWKPVVTALLLPPVPFLLLMLIGARLILARRGLGWSVVLGGAALTWSSGCVGVAQWLSPVLLQPPSALSAPRVQALRASANPATAIVVLGGGLEPLAPEYGTANLSHYSLERLRYGVWLGRQTGLPVAFSGGVGWAQPDAMPEARIAAAIAAGEFARPLKWVEDQSRDTRENAGRTVALLRPAGIRHIVLVTHGWHMPRALRAFRAAAGPEIRIEPAPMGLARGTELPVLNWLPSTKGLTDVRHVLREWLGRVAGA
ncbi:MAG: YdcF family protein [Pseudomonadota bacterium]